MHNLDLLFLADNYFQVLINLLHKGRNIKINYISGLIKVKNT